MYKKERGRSSELNFSINATEKKTPHLYFHVNIRHNGRMLEKKKQTSLLSTVVCCVVGWASCCSTWDSVETFAYSTVPIGLHSKRWLSSVFTELKISNIHNLYCYLGMKQLWSPTDPLRSAHVLS